jgi:thiamine kinase-like enzyme
VVWDELIKRKDDALWISHSHGDMTYKNIMTRENKKMVIIDWENFGLRPIYGIDVIHYIFRLIHQGNLNLNVSLAIADFKKGLEKYNEKFKLDFTEKEIENLFLIDWFFEILQKNDLKKYHTVIPLMQKIWFL